MKKFIIALSAIFIFSCQTRPTCNMSFNAYKEARENYLKSMNEPKFNPNLPYTVVSEDESSSSEETPTDFKKEYEVASENYQFCLSRQNAYDQNQMNWMNVSNSINQIQMQNNMTQMKNDIEFQKIQNTQMKNELDRQKQINYYNLYKK